MGKFRVCLTLFVLAFPALSQERLGEWILTQETPKDWAELVSSLGGQGKFVRAFGPGKRHAVVRWARLPARIRERRGLHVQPNYTYRALSNSDPDLEKNWGLENFGQLDGISGVDIAARKAWTIGEGSRSVRVAVLDTGTDFRHEDLQTNILKNSGEIPGNGRDDDRNGFVDDVLGWDFVSDDANPQDDRGHGSLCAGIIGADAGNGKGSRGVAGKVGLITVKIIDATGLLTTERAVRGIDYAISRGAQIINASWGGNYYDSVLYEAVKRANNAGVLFVAAAGNDHLDNDRSPYATYPASYDLPNVISVAAYDNRDGRARFSNHGRTRVHLGAPGVGIFGPTLDGYQTNEGTSFAAPYVSGVAALVKAAWPGISAAQIKERLLGTSTPISYYEREFSASGGRLNAENALSGFRPERFRTPVTWQREQTDVATEHPYPPSSLTTLKISAPGATHVRVHFKNFDLEEGYDVLTLKDREGRVVYTYTGNLGEFTSTDALGDELILELKTDFNQNRYGFDIDYLEASTE